MKFADVKTTLSFKRRSLQRQASQQTGLAEEDTTVANDRYSISTPVSVQSSKVAWLLGLEAQPADFETSSALRSTRNHTRRAITDQYALAAEQSDEDEEFTTYTTQPAADASDDEDDMSESDADTVEIPIMLETAPRIEADVSPALAPFPISPLDQAFEVDDESAESGEDGYETVEEDEEEEEAAVQYKPAPVQPALPLVVVKAEPLFAPSTRVAPPSPPKSARRALLVKSHTTVPVITAAAEPVFEAPLKLPVIELTPLVVEQDTEYEDFCERMLLERLARPQWQSRPTSTSTASYDTRLGLSTPSLSSSASSVNSAREQSAAQKLQQQQRDQAAHEAKRKLAAARDALQRVKVGGQAVRTPVDAAKVLEQVEGLRVRLNREQARSMPSLASLVQAETDLISPPGSSASSIKSSRSSRRLARDREFDGPKQNNIRIGIAAPRDLQAFARSTAAQKLAGGPSAGLGQPRPMMPTKAAKARAASSYKPQTHITSIEELLI